MANIADHANFMVKEKSNQNLFILGNTLLSAFGPLLVAVCTDHNKYPDVDLQTSASLAIAKFMMVSSEFCDKHLQLLFTILEKSTSQTIRANTIIALGDLSFRFPNLIEPWTPHLYARSVTLKIVMEI